MRTKTWWIVEWGVILTNPVHHLYQIQSHPMRTSKAHQIRWKIIVDIQICKSLLLLKLMDNKIKVSMEDFLKMKLPGPVLGKRITLIEWWMSRHQYLVMRVRCLWNRWWRAIMLAILNFMRIYTKSISIRQKARKKMALALVVLLIHQTC